MEKPYPVKITIISQKGTCDVGHKVGESWVVDLKTLRGICCEAFHVLWSAITVFCVGANHPWDPGPGVAYMACPDVKNPVVFEVKRIEHEKDN